MDTQGVKTHLLETSCKNKVEFDGGIRGQLYMDLDYNKGVRQMIDSCKAHTIYMITDQFDVHYLLFQLPDEEAYIENKYVLFGPYILGVEAQNIEEVIKRNSLSLYQASLLKEYYYGLPVITLRDGLETIVLAAARYFWKDEEFQIERLGIYFYEEHENNERLLDEEKKLSMDRIEERYRCEDEMLEAIEQGNYTKVVLAESLLKKYRMEPRAKETLRDAKNMVMIMNSLYRKAVQKASVYPAHIDRLSTLFAKRIEGCASEGQLEKLTKEMARKYCLLVINHSLKGYSPSVQNTINYIDFNLTETLTLKSISEKILVNSSYLSARFKKETGENITDYIGRRRIDSSISLLATTNLPIQVIAEKVGINDENYYSRLFKKLKSRTPREYRNMMKVPMK